MSQLITWDQTGERFFETGVDHGVLYDLVTNEGVSSYTNGVAWNGLTNVTETPSGAEDSALYADNIKYLTLKSAEEFGITVEAYSYPDEWEKHDGIATAVDGSNNEVAGVKLGQQKRTPFGLSYRTKIGNDVDGDSHGYKLHLVYGCNASPSERAYQTVNDSPEAISFSWEVSTTPVAVGDGSKFKPVSLMTIDSRTANSDNLAALSSSLECR